MVSRSEDETRTENKEQENKNELNQQHEPISFAIMFSLFVST